MEYLSYMFNLAMSCSEPMELPCIGKRPMLPGMVCSISR